MPACASLSDGRSMAMGNYQLPLGCSVVIWENICWQRLLLLPAGIECSDLASLDVAAMQNRAVERKFGLMSFGLMFGFLVLLFLSAFRGAQSLPA